MPNAKSNCLALAGVFLFVSMGTACLDLGLDLGKKKEGAEKELPPHNPIELSPRMIELEGQTFQMGKLGSDKKAQRDEKSHVVDLSNSRLLLSETEVTQELYQAVMGVNPSEFADPTAPVERVAWLDAIEFCNMLSEKEDLTPVYEIQGDMVTWRGAANGYRLPSEAEWEFAARAGQATLYAGSDRSGEVAWTRENSKKKTHSVAQRAPNAFGLYDMSGNVWEWVWDWHQCGSPSFDKFKICDGDFPPNSRLPTGWENGSEKVFRGGSYKNKGTSARVSNRGFYLASATQSNVGFRVARSITPYPSDATSIPTPAEPTRSDWKRAFKKLKGQYDGYLEPTLKDYREELKSCVQEYKFDISKDCLAHCALYRLDRYAYNGDHPERARPVGPQVRSALQSRGCF